MIILTPGIDDVRNVPVGDVFDVIFPPSGTGERAGIWRKVQFRVVLVETIRDQVQRKKTGEPVLLTRMYRELRWRPLRPEEIAEYENASTSAYTPISASSSTTLQQAV